MAKAKKPPLPPLPPPEPRRTPVSATPQRYDVGVGRKTLLTPALIEVAEKSALAGLKDKDITPRLGVDYKTFYNWMKFGQAEGERQDRVREAMEAAAAAGQAEELAKLELQIQPVGNDGLYLEFFRRVSVARSRLKEGLLHSVFKHAVNDGALALKALAVIDSDYSPKPAIEMGDVNVGVVVDGAASDIAGATAADLAEAAESLVVKVTARRRAEREAARAAKALTVDAEGGGSE